MRILVIEDEARMRAILKDNLEYEGFDVMAVESGELGLSGAAHMKPDLVLLDLALPRMTGYEVCRRLRASSETPMVPIIMLSARNTEMDRIAGLELGADDYIGKPFSIRELVARVRAQQRRTTPADSSESVAFGDIRISQMLRTVHRGSELVELSTREFDLLLYLIRHRNQVVTRERLLKDVWGYKGLTLTRTVDNFVAKLRKKIEHDVNRPRHILTVHGTGYRLVF